MDFELFHRLTFYALYLCLLLLTFIVIERVLYFIYLGRRVRGVTRVLRVRGFDPRSLAGAETAGRTDIVSQALHDYIAFQQGPGADRARVEDFSGALFLDVDGRLNARLWMLDTIVTAAPLLGLLGTILGIMQTFGALAAGGTSDPAAVSRGIGTALVATALGIGTALYGLIGHNMLHRQAEHLSETFKAFLLRTTL